MGACPPPLSASTCCCACLRAARTCRLLNQQRDNTLLRNAIAEANIGSPHAQPKCSVCSKTIKAEKPPEPSGPDSALLLTLNKQLQQQLHQAQQQLVLQQQKALEQQEQQELQARVGGGGRPRAGVRARVCDARCACGCTGMYGRRRACTRTQNGAPPAAG